MIISRRNVSNSRNSTYAILSLFVFGCVLSAIAQNSAFSYQGRLDNNGAPANGIYDLNLSLYTSSTGGSRVGPSLTKLNLVISNGIFSTVLDFGNVFNGTATWLEVGVKKTGDTNPFVFLSPRNQLLAVPNSVFAQNVTASGITGTISDTQLSANVARLNTDAVFTGTMQFSNPSNIFAGQFRGDGSAVSNINASSLTGSLTTTNPMVRGVVTYGSDIASISESVTNNFPATPTIGLIRRCLYAPYDARQQTNWCLILRSPTHLNGEYSMAVDPTGWPTDMPTEYVFGMDGSSFVVYLRGNGSYMGVEVDGADDGSRIYTPPDGNFHYYTVQFSSPARRQIALKLGANYQLGGVYVSPTNGMWPGVLPKQHRMIVVGDSFSEDSDSLHWPSCLMSLFQNLDVWASAVGATGYINSGISTRTNFQGRIYSDVITNNPEYVVFAGGINDCTMLTNSAMASALNSACRSVYQAVQVKAPNCKIVVLGPFWPGTPPGDPNHPIYQANAAISNACLAAGIISNYVDTLSDPWVTGTWNQPGSGNAVNYTSSDSTHPTEAGDWNLAYHVAAELARRFPELSPREKTR